MIPRSGTRRIPNQNPRVLALPRNSRTAINKAFLIADWPPGRRGPPGGRKPFRDRLTSRGFQGDHDWKQGSGLRRGALEQPAATAEDQQAIAQAFGMGHDMGREEDRAPPGLEVLEHLLQNLLIDRIKP